MPRTPYTPQESAVWNATFSAAFVDCAHLLNDPDKDDRAAEKAIELAGRAVEALRRAQKRLG